MACPLLNDDDQLQKCNCNLPTYLPTYLATYIQLIEFISETMATLANDGEKIKK